MTHITYYFSRRYFSKLGKIIGKYKAILKFWAVIKTFISSLLFYLFELIFIFDAKRLSQQKNKHFVN